MPRVLLPTIMLAIWTVPAIAWNGLGYTVVAGIAQLQLSPDQRQTIVDTLRRHHRFDQDFDGKITDDVSQADQATQDRWIFQHAATWLDIARNITNDNRMVWNLPTWHYVDFPPYLDPSDRVLADKLTFNRSTEYPTQTPKKEYNVMQALAYCRDVLDSRAGPGEKAIACCWLFHLVGDLHQSLHSTALVSVNQFPEGDRGGNEIPLRRGRNLHSLWDNLLDRRYYMRDVDRAVAELSDRERYGDVWDTAAKESDAGRWVAESRELAKLIVYSDAILNAVQNTPAGEKIERIELSDAYLRQAGDVARRRVIAAGIRFGTLLNSKPLAQQAAADQVEIIDTPTSARAPAPSLHVPAGFSVKLVAGPPLVERPITAAFDDAGRLYVADSSGSNDPVEQQLKTRPHRIVRLEDVDGDGRYDRSTVFADRMMFPEGTMYYDGSLFVAAPPSIWKLTDTNDDGIADEREEWFRGKTLTGCANDVHGPYLGPDGWIYWCKGAFAQQTHPINGQVWTTRAAHIFRCRPDGSGLDVVMTGGMDNPVDVTFTRSGERVFSATFLVHPGNGQRDGLAHAVYGGVFGKVHGVLEGHPRTGPLLPVLTHMGPAAPCGLERYDSDVFGAEYADNLFACQFNMHKVSRHVLVPTGSSFATQNSDFVTSDSVDFHPTDVLMDADGSLLIIDTGGWYKLCCPTSQLEKPDILGGIYRVRKKSARPPHNPRGRQLAWSKFDVSQLWELLSDKRPAVRQRAMSALRTQRNTGAMRKFLAQASRGHAVDLGNDRTAALARIWALGQIDTVDAQGLILAGLDHSDEEVRHAALNLVSLRRDAASGPKLLEILASDIPANRRAAAEALGRIGSRSAVAPLLAASAAADDRMLRHAIIFALIELADADATRVGLTSSDYRIQAASLIALDQMPDGGLDPSSVVAMLDSPDAGLRKSSVWVLSRRPQWGGYVAEWFNQQLADRSHETRSSADATLENLLVAFSTNSIVEDWMASQLHQHDSSESAQKLVLSAMARSKQDAAPAKWLQALAELLNDSNSRLLTDAVAAIRALPPPNQANLELNKSLARVADNARLPMEPRVQALAIISGSLPSLNDSQFALLVKCCAEESPLLSRSAAADAISTARLSTEQLEVLCDLIKAARPLEINRLIDPFAHSTDERLGMHLLSSLKEAKSLPALRIDPLRESLKKYGPRVQQGVDELQALLNVDLEDQRRRITDLLPRIAAGDVRRGQAVFYSSKAACSACHRMGYAGGLTGPDLTLVGKTRTRRDLLESIVFPSLSFVRSFEPVVVVTSDGRVLNGLIRDTTSTQVVLATGPNQEVRLLLNDVDEIQPSNISVMPAGLDKQLSLQELADVIAFLEHAKGK